MFIYIYIYVWVGKFNSFVLFLYLCVCVCVRELLAKRKKMIILQNTPSPVSTVYLSHFVETAEYQF